MKTTLAITLMLLLFNNTKSQTVNHPGDSAKSFEKKGLWREAGFPGGSEKFQEYIKENLHRPANSPAFQGRVITWFVVEKDGSLTNIRVVRGLSPDIDKEAVRLIRESPKWIPEIQNGILVRVAYTVPVSFTLNN